MRNGTRPVSPETVALLREFLNVSAEECREAVARSICDNPKNADKADRLRRAFFALVLAVGAGLSALTPSGEQQNDEPQPVDLLYIVAHWFARLRKAATLRPGYVTA